MGDALERTWSMETSWDTKRQTQLWIKMGIFFLKQKQRKKLWHTSEQANLDFITTWMFGTKEGGWGVAFEGDIFSIPYMRIMLLLLKERQGLCRNLGLPLLYNNFNWKRKSSMEGTQKLGEPRAGCIRTRKTFISLQCLLNTDNFVKQVDFTEFAFLLFVYLILSFIQVFF